MGSQVVREVEVSKLAEKDGYELVLRHLYQPFRPRRQQEARELYVAGAQTHGVLSRQSDEPLTSFLLHRRTWYKMLCDLDDKLALPEVILSEQVKWHFKRPPAPDPHGIGREDDGERCLQ